MVRHAFYRMWTEKWRPMWSRRKLKKALVFTNITWLKSRKFRLVGCTTKLYFSPLCRLLKLAVSEKSQNLRRLEAQRNELNAKGWLEVLMVIACDCVRFSSLVTRGTTAASRAGLSCWRGSETDGQEESAREGMWLHTVSSVFTFTCALDCRSIQKASTW